MTIPVPTTSTAVSEELLAAFNAEAKAVQPKDALEKLTYLVRVLKDLNDAILDFETSITEYKARAREISQVEIPNLLAQYGLSEIKLSDGRKITVKQDCRASVKDYEAFYQFLKSRGEDHLLKTTLELGKMPAVAVQAAQKAVLQVTGVAPESKTVIAPQTLFAWVRSNIGLGKSVPEELLDKDSIPGVSVYTFSDTKIK